MSVSMWFFSECFEAMPAVAAPTSRHFPRAYFNISPYLLATVYLLDILSKVSATESNLFAISMFGIFSFFILKEGWQIIVRNSEVFFNLKVIMQYIKGNYPY